MIAAIWGCHSGSPFRDELGGIMNFKSAFLTTMILLAGTATARAEEWVDYAPGNQPWTVTTVKVAPGKLDEYLVSLKGSWAQSMENQKKTGDVLDYHILVSANPNSPGANVVFLVKFKDWSELAPNKERDQKLLAEFRKSVTKEAETKQQDDRLKFRSFLDDGTFADISYLK